MFATADDAPENFQIFPANSLLVHKWIAGGEKAVDLIRYRQHRVIFIEATVSCHSTQIQRRATILRSIEKWLGKDVFEVKPTVLVCTEAAICVISCHEISLQPTRSTSRVLRDCHYVSRDLLES